ncbi:MAG: hypothetical protein GWM90_14755 [Gemmatimonadetes bacterium]|nr:hypothetical protein [Gemmatimonadota bacterium]NIQ55439.1 hypothetical protein [Gemmatimonadota bacterium]NIU75647.1 hypothetical protein [Gammaproteobacteria bacterium]NIX45322.1 hypothetical protein [Gemmatimonadota bacterium]NIY09605.1 hypothetical protein [Gemmatimonadota bacterium]
MIGTIAKTFAYTKAPRTTFFVLHPKKAVKLRKMRYDIRHAYAPRVAAAGALAVGLPLGYMLGRSTNGHGRAR